MAGASASEPCRDETTTNEKEIETMAMRINPKTTEPAAAAASLIRQWGNQALRECEWRASHAKRDATKTFYRAVWTVANDMVKEGTRPAEPEPTVEPGKKHPAQLKLDGLRKKVRRLAADIEANVKSGLAPEDEAWTNIAEALLVAANPKEQPTE